MAEKMLFELSQMRITFSLDLIRFLFHHKVVKLFLYKRKLSDLSLFNRLLCRKKLKFRSRRVFVGISRGLVPLVTGKHLPR